MQAQNPFWKNLLYSTQYQLTAASYVKCSTNWRDTSFTPEFNRFYLILDGEGMVELNGKRYYPKPGQLFFLPGGVVQSYSTISENTFLKYYVHFTAKVGGSNLFQFLELPVFITVESMEPWIRKFEDLLGAYRDKSYFAVFRQQAVLLDILFSFAAQAGPDRIQFRVPDAMEKMEAILAHIDEHLSANYTVEQLAAHFHYHPNHLIRVFKRFTGYTPIQYINRRKMEAAKFRLLSTDQSVADISLAVGMEPHYFSRMFKEYSGYSPSLFRTWNRNQPADEQGRHSGKS